MKQQTTAKRATNANNAFTYFFVRTAQMSSPRTINPKIKAIIMFSFYANLLHGTRPKKNPTKNEMACSEDALIHHFQHQDIFLRVAGPRI